MKSIKDTKTPSSTQTTPPGISTYAPIIATLSIFLLISVGVMFSTTQKDKQQTQAYQEAQTPLPTGVLKYVKMDNTFPLAQKNYLDLPQTLKGLKDQKWQTLSCLEPDGYGKQMNIETISADVHDNRLISALNNIKNYEYSDEKWVINEDGSKTLTNQGKRSKKGIIFETICKDEQNYYIVFTTTALDLFKPQSLFTPKVVYAGGGGYWGPGNFALVNKNDEISIIENLNDNSVKIEIPNLAYNKRMYPKWYVMKKEHGLPYYSCRNIYGVSANQVYIECGGGDGPGAGRGIFQINLMSKQIREVVFCSNAFTPEYGYEKESCYDETGDIFIQKDKTFSN